MTIGITGGIGAGKSLVSRILESLNYPVFYSDKEAKLLVERDLAVKNKIKNLLGEKAYVNEVYNTAFVANIVFSEAEKLQQLNQIIHPAVRIAFQQFALKQSAKLVFNEAAILYETGAYKNFDKTILVCADMEIRMARIQKRDNTNRDEINSRFSKQWSDEKKRPLADFTIENNEKESVLIQLDQILQILHSGN